MAQAGPADSAFSQNGTACILVVIWPQRVLSFSKAQEAKKKTDADTCKYIRVLRIRDQIMNRREGEKKKVYFAVYIYIYVMTNFCDCTKLNPYWLYYSPSNLSPHRTTAALGLVYQNAAIAINCLEELRVYPLGQRLLIAACTRRRPVCPAKNATARLPSSSSSGECFHGDQRRRYDVLHKLQ